MEGYVLYGVSLLIVPVLAWNIDTGIPITFSWSKDSYFGFSVALHQNSKGSFALVSATKANSTFGPRRSLHQPGVVYKCNITTTECEEVILETTANDVSPVGSSVSYKAKEDNMWLGVSLDVQSTGKGYILACGHLWRNQERHDAYFVNGACYTIDSEFRRSSYEVLLPLIDKDKQEITTATDKKNSYYYAYATAGMSATFVEDATEFDILMGAPGFNNWKGTVVSYHGDPHFALQPVVPRLPEDRQSNQHAYIGYSVASGSFYAFGRLQFVVGAPRDGELQGRVYIFESLHHNQSNIAVLQKLQGDQMGEYFGACVAGVNINGDSYTDLFIGSPLHSVSGYGDEGKVYVYMSDGEKLVKHRELMGLKKPKSRFGTTIANIGDVNQDGFIDVAIGAPYEDDRGAIYIYHGSSKGLDENYKQRIAATDINPTLLGFGISISKGKDIDGNKYPDILVGSYASDNAILFRTRPLIKVFGSITFDPPQINTNRSRCTWNDKSVPCFNVTFCLQYEGNHVSDQIDISTLLTSYRKRQRDGLQRRRYLSNGNQLSFYIRQAISLTRGRKHCYDDQAYVVTDPEDFISPIEIWLTFTLTHDVSKEKTFCKFCPMLHPDLPSKIIGTIRFHTGCGEDGICDSDLVLTVNVLGLSSDELIVGQDNVIILSIELQNIKEPAYNTYIHINLPSDVQIINQDSCENTNDHYGIPTIICDAGNPLTSGRVAKFKIKLDTSEISTELDYLRIRANATTASKEAKPEDNIRNIDIPLKILADITIVGNPIVEQIILEKKHLEAGEPSDIIHQYTVLKYLPATIKSVAIEFLIPTTLIDEDVNFLQLKSFKINEGSQAAVTANCRIPAIGGMNTTITPEVLLNTTTTTEKANTIPTPKPRRRRSVDSREGMSASSSSSEQNGLRNYVLDCNNSLCTRISCTAGPFKDTNLVATFRIYGSVNITSLKAMLDQRDQVRIVTEGKVKIRDSRKNFQPINHRPDEAKVSTTVQHAFLLLSQKIEIWIIIVSVIVGVFLLIIISLVLIKMGFFQRKEKEYMEKAMMKAELERQPMMTANTN